MLGDCCGKPPGINNLTFAEDIGGKPIAIRVVFSITDSAIPSFFSDAFNKYEAITEIRRKNKVVITLLYTPLISLMLHIKQQTRTLLVGYSLSDKEIACLSNYECYKGVGC